MDTFEPLSNSLATKEVKYQRINSEIVNMSFFDFLEKADITMKGGYIKKELDEYVEGVQLGDRLRYAFLHEESEYYCNVQEDRIQNEFIWHLLKHIALGGSMCQFEENINVYLDQIKLLYKDLITVGKDPDSGEIKVFSHAYKIDSIEGTVLYPTKEHP